MIHLIKQVFFTKNMLNFPKFCNVVLTYHLDRDKLSGLLVFAKHHFAIGTLTEFLDLFEASSNFYNSSLWLCLFVLLFFKLWFWLNDLWNFNC